LKFLKDVFIINLLERTILGKREKLTMKRFGKSGFSLIEILITVAILAVIVITLIPVFIYGFNLLQKTKQVALATQVAQLEVEQYRNMSFDRISQSPLGSTTRAFNVTEFPSLFTDQGNPYLRNGQMETSLTRGDVSSGTFGDSNIFKLTVIITWQYHNRQMRKDVVTYFSKGGVNRS
jgi:prepilin-type N-terminal cleavage/methylation domain-containing protein